MGQEEEAVPLPATVVVASWEPGVVKSAAEDRDMPPESPRKAKAPERRPSVPPPPGRPSAVAAGSRSFSRAARAVRPEDDPFLAAYLACTRSGGTGGGGGARRNGGGLTSRPAEPKGRRRFTWAGLVGLSCKGSGAAVEQSMVKLAKRPELDPRDA